jgi:hypothetical protein
MARRLSSGVLTDNGLDALPQTVITRLVKMLTRPGVRKWADLRAESEAKR